MAIEKDMITHYDNIVPMLKRLFYYGSDSLTDMGENGIAQHSKCSEDIKIIRYVFGDLLEEYTNANGNKVYRLRNNHFEDTQRFLMKFFALKKIAIDKLFVSMFVIQTLNVRKGIALTNKELTSKLLKTLSVDASEKTMYNWINNLAKCGILRKTGKTYTLADRLLCEGELMRTTREKLLLLTDFCSNVLPLAICGGGVRTKLDMKYRSPFLFKHSYPGRIFDDETLWKLLVYIEYRQPISFSYPENSSVKNFPAPYLPYRIITDKFSGRQYLFLVSLQGELRVPYLLRIDKMQHLKPAEDQSVTLPDEEELEKIYTDALRFSFSGINIPRNRKKPPVTGRLVFRSDAERVILRRFPEAVITPVEDTHSSTEIQVYNMDEMKAWLRTNINRIRLTESSDGTAQALQNELEEWRNGGRCMASAENTPKIKKTAGEITPEKEKKPREKTVRSAVTELAGLSLSDEFNNFFTVAVIRTLNELRINKMSEEEFLRRIKDLTEETEDTDNLLWKYIDRLKSGDTDILLDKSDRKNWQLTSSSEIPMPLSLVERVYLKAILESRYCPIFFDEDEKNQLLERFADVPSVGLEKNIVIAGSHGHPRTFPPDEIDKIRKLLSAVRYQKEIEYSNKTKDKVYLHYKGFPVRIEYSVFDDRFRLSLWSSDESRPIKINISSMYDISETGRTWKNPLAPQKMMETKLSPEPIRMTLTGKDHQFERALYSFSMYDTVIERTGENECSFTLRYYGFDLPEIIDKIMSFGPAMQVLSPSEAIDRIRERLTAWN